MNMRLNTAVPLTLLAVLLAAPAIAQDAPPATDAQDAQEQAQMKAEETQQQTPPPTTYNEAATTTDTTTTTSNEAATDDAAMTSNDASAAMQSTTGAAAAASATAATGAGVSTAVLPTGVVVTSRPGDSISSNYRIDFAALDSNSDDNLSKAEVNASGNADLTREFVAVDIDHNGRLSKDELKGWMD